VTYREWNSIKEQIRGIRSRESLWLSALSALASGGVSFGVGLASLSFAQGVAPWVLITFWVLTAGGVVAAVVCVFGYMESRGHRRSDAERVVQHMDDLEARYRGIS
jgi:hypothetical protein